MNRLRSIAIHQPRRSLPRFGLALALGLLTSGWPAQAEAVSEFWPELGVFVALDSDTRLFLNLP